MVRTHTSTSESLPHLESGLWTAPHNPPPASPSKPRLWPEPHKYTDFDIDLLPGQRRVTRSRGHKRHREPSPPPPPQEEVEEEPEQRTVIKLKFRRPFSTTETQPTPPVFIPYQPDYGRRQMPGYTGPHRPSIEPESRPPTPPPSGCPPTKRSRAYSGSSNLIGIYTSDDSAPPSPVDTTSPSLTHRTPSTPTASSSGTSTNNHRVHPSYVPSPLASTPVVGRPPSCHSRTRSDHSPAASSDVEMGKHSSPSISGPQDAFNPRSQLMRTRHKLFRSDDEALSTEMNNVFKLGYGRGMGRAMGGARGPSRLRSGNQGAHAKKEEEMDVDE
ncbi:uncharacterized protein I303_101921 [Kwoniella dejecticola CBS 10117]|uniref:Uncharacterized protein n=1 Tax=Kwoniella dejecticola CBS 10117 TaxID=1296121 RepID=A0A1A6ACD3_9TREE|nr:uncharacterized protein I303_01943 [Kwoniella dejecticola CBS 10117]OBR87731.1 hypothetical protein I303_01943 [Kwoniella dejecticola CBS 10117]